MTFWRKPLPEITNDSYARWLRAHRPLLGRDRWWFFRQPQMIQEALAVEGDGYVLHCIDLASGEMGEPQSTQDTDEDVARRIAADLVAQRLGAVPSPPPDPIPMSMAGASQRRKDNEKRAVRDQVAHKSFLGQRADSVVETPEENGTA